MPKTAGTRVPRPPDLTNDLRKLLNLTQGKASGWMQQRDEIAGELATIRDTVQQLLVDLAGPANSPAPGRTDPALLRRPGRKPGFKLSASARRKIARAARRNWAERRARSK